MFNRAQMENTIQCTMQLQSFYYQYTYLETDIQYKLIPNLNLRTNFNFKKSLQIIIFHQFDVLIYFYKYVKEINSLIIGYDVYEGRKSNKKLLEKKDLLRHGTTLCFKAWLRKTARKAQTNQLEED